MIRTTHISRKLSQGLNVLSQAERRFASDGYHDQPNRFRLVFGIWLGLCALVAAIVYAVGFPPVWTTLSDTLMLLGGGWRIHEGQVPHRDFFTPIGPYPMGLLGLGFVINSANVTGFPKALLLAGIILSAGSWLASRDRLTPWYRLLFATVILLLPIAWASLDAPDGPPFGFRFHTTYAMFYNRVGWAALMIEMLITLIPRRNPVSSTPQIAWEGLLVGVTMALCVFCKINYLIAATGLAVFWMTRSPSNRGARLAGLVLGFLAVTLLFAIYPGGVLLFFRDQWQAIQAGHSITYVGLWFERFVPLLPILLTLFALHLWSVLACHAAEREDFFREELMGFTLSFLAAIAASLFVTTFNTDGMQVPGLTIAGFITVEMLLRGAVTPDSITATATPRSVLVKIVFALLVANYLCFDGGSLVYGLLWKRKNPDWAAKSVPLNGPLFGVIPIPVQFNEVPDRETLERSIEVLPHNASSILPMSSLQFARWLDDGAGFLAPRITAGDNVFVADWPNPFAELLSVPQAKGGMMVWMINDKSHPDVMTTTNAITWFMIPKFARDNTTRDLMLKLYGNNLSRDFTKEGESRFWTCWKRIRR